jgi:PAS domain S-box-containing protein
MGELSKIKDLLKNNPRGMNIREISEILKINRNSVAKLLDILTAKEEVEIRVHGRSKIYYLAKPQNYRKWFELLSRTVEELNNFPPDGDIYAFIAGTLKHIAPEDTIIIVNSFDPDTNIITVHVVEGLGLRQPDIEAILSQPLNGFSFTVPAWIVPEMLNGECNEMPGGLANITFGRLPYEICKKIEEILFLGKIYTAGISWKGSLKGTATFLLPEGAELENHDLITFFIRQVAGFLSRKDSEAALKANETKFQSLYSLMRLMCDTVPDMIWAKDLEKKYIFTNKAICRNLLNAADTDEPTGKNDLFFAERERICHADDPEWHTFGEICRDTDQITLDAGTPQQFDEYGNVQGEFLFLDVRKAPFLDEQGKIIGTVGSARDVTQSKQMESELRESEAFNRGLVENLPDYIAVYGLDGNLLYVNPASARILEYDENTLIGTHVLSYVAEEYRDTVTAKMATHLLKGGDTSPYEIDLVTKNGLRRSVIVKSTPIQYMSNPAILLLLNDITERKRAEERLSEINKAFLTFSPDPLDNITILTGLAGKMLQGSCALYNRLEGGMLCSLGMWNTPPDFVPRDQAEGHICYDVILNGGCSPTLIPDLMESPYAETDPNVKRYQLKAYVGLPVKIGEKQFGSLCVVYHDTYVPSPQDLEILSFLAKAIAIEDERRTTLQALQVSESKFRSLMEYIPLGIQGYDPDGKIFFWNKASEKIYGYSMEEALGNDLGTLIIPDDIKPFYHASLLSATTMTKSGEFSPEGEVYLTRKDGTRVLLRSIHVAVCDEGKLPMLYCIDIDLTDRERIEGEKRRSEEALRESEERLRSFIDQALEGISIIDEERRIIEWNPAQERITGISRAEAMGVNAWDLATRMIPDMQFWEEIRSRLKESLNSTIQSGTSIHPDPVYYQFHRPDGTIAIANQTVFLIKTSRGHMIGTLNQDVTEQQRTDEKIRESERSYRGLFNTVRQAIYILDHEGKFIDVNDGAEAMYGYARDEFVGRTPEFLSAPGKNNVASVMEQIHNAFVGEPQQFEFWGLRKNGEIFPKDVRLYKGTYFGRDVVIAIGTDITERKRE